MEHLLKAFILAEGEEERRALEELVSFFLSLYDDEVESYARRLEIEYPKGDDDERGNLEDYIASLLFNIKNRYEAKESELRESGMPDYEIDLAMASFITTNAKEIIRTQSNNASQLAQLHVLMYYQILYPDAVLEKTWVAFPDCCKICEALDGTTIPISEPFLVKGQEVELSDGSSYIYDYVDRLVCVAHPNDRCVIEFSIRR